MQLRQFHDLRLSRLMLGTVQFGLDYGIANVSGQPTLEAVRDIIACAYEGGVRCLDTAAAYGSSEEALGEVLTDLRLAEEMVIATKIVHLPEGLGASEADAMVEESAVRSLRRLRLDALPICLYHIETDFVAYADSLFRLKEKGLARHVGCSVNTPEGMRRVVDFGTAEAIQMPASVLDRRYTGSGAFADAATQGAALFARSVYLQGLILMREDSIPRELRQVVPVLGKLSETARQAGMGIAELATRYVLGMDQVTSLVMGVDSLDHMRENLELFSKGPLPADVHRAVEDAVPDLPEAILCPSNWSRRTPNSR